MKTEEKSAAQFVKLMGEYIDEGMSYLKRLVEKVEGPVNLDESETYRRRDNKPIDKQTIKQMERMARDYKMKIKVKGGKVEVSGAKKKLNDFGMIFVGRSRYGDLTTA